MKPLELGAFLSLGTIWGASFLFIKWASDPQEGFPPLTLVAMRQLTASVAMLLYNTGVCFYDAEHRDYLANLWRDHPDFFWKALVMGILNNSLPFTLVAWAESNKYVNVGVASVIDSAIPIFAQIFGHFLLHDEKLSLQRVLAIMVGFGGVIVICLEKMLNLDSDTTTDENKWRTLGYYFMIIVATASYGLASVFGRMHLLGFKRSLAITGQIVGGALVNTLLACTIDFFAPFDAFSDKPHFSFFQQATLRSYLSIAYLGLVATCGAYVFYFYLLRTVGSVKQAMVGFMLPVVGMILGIFVQHEWEGVNPIYKLLEVLGAVMVVASIILVNFKSGQKKPTPSDATAAPTETSALLGGEGVPSQPQISRISDLRGDGEDGSSSPADNRAQGGAGRRALRKFESDRVVTENYSYDAV